MGDFLVVGQEMRSAKTQSNQTKAVGIVRDILT